MARFRARIWRWIVAGVAQGRARSAAAGQRIDAGAPPGLPRVSTAIIRDPVQSRTRWSRTVTPVLPQPVLTAVSLAWPNGVSQRTLPHPSRAISSGGLCCVWASRIVSAKNGEKTSDLGIAIRPKDARSVATV